MVGTHRRLAFGAAGVVAALAVALVAAPTALAVQHEVKIVAFAFAPSSVTVNVGDTVEWTNGDPVSHTATADDGSWDTGTIAGSTNASISFDTAGTFPYHCSIHSTMHGTIVVEAAAPTPTPTRPAGSSRPPARTPPPTDAAARSTESGAVAGLGALVLIAAAAVGVEVARRRFRSRPV